MRRTDREVTSKEDIKSILDICKVCRLGMMDETGIYIVPVNFGYCFENEKLVLYFHGAKEGRKIALAMQKPMVGVEMDCEYGLEEGASPCQYSYGYASLIGNGQAEVIDEAEEKVKALGSIMKHQTGKEFREFEENPKLAETVGIIKVTVEQFSCKEHKQK